MALPSTRVLVGRLVLVTFGLLLSTACGSQGCEGCQPQPIPGGFPQQERIDNAMQVRVTPSGFNFLEENFASLLEMVVPGGSSFPIPSSCGGTYQVCCGQSDCSATLIPTNVQITPLAPNLLRLNLQGTVETTYMSVEYDVPLVGYVGCDVKYDSAVNSPATVTLNMDLQLVVQPSDNNKLVIARSGGTINGFSCDDLSYESAMCTVAGWFCPMFQGTIESQLVGMVDTFLDGMLQALPMGQEGRFDVAGFLRSFSPRTTGIIDYLTWAGGYAQAEQEGVSLGALSGFRAPEHNVCVPDCEAPGAPCTPPQRPAIPRSASFSGNSRPDGQPFHVAIGVHQKALEQAAYAFWRGGGLCLDISSHTFAQLSSDMLGIMLTSIKDLTGGVSSPMMVSIRPRRPPVVSLGQGSYHTDDKGKVLIDDPLIRIMAPELAVDVFLLLDERMVRIFTVVGDLEVPVLLFADAQGRLNPMIGSLDKAYTNLRMEGDALIRESSEELAKLFPTILTLASGFLAGGFEPIELPSVQQLQLQLDEGSLTSADGGQFLAIYANLGLLQTTGYGPGPAGQQLLRSTASLERLELPPLAAFQLGPSFDPAAGPVAVLRLSAELPDGAAGRQVEHAYRIDGGFYHPWTVGPQLRVQDPALWLPGKHQIEVLSRVVGQPRTVQPTPVAVEVIIDPEAPQVVLRSTASGARAEVRDAVSPADALELSWSVSGGPYSAYAALREISAAPGAQVAVRVRDEAGNVGTAVLAVVALEGAGGCSLGGSGSGSLPLLLALLLGLGWAWRRRR